MSLLAPLYIAAGLAIGLPILFHLIRRQPKGQKRFSSLMFLTPSPPQLSRRSRLDHLLLLLLRALALICLAIAFGRPFLRSAADTEVQPPGRRTCILVDTSASMRREDLMQQAQSAVDKVLEEADAKDRLMLVAFDREPTVLFNGIEQRELTAEQQAAKIREAIKSLVPSWYPTDVGTALVQVADLLSEAAEDPEHGAASASQVVLISDLQEGAALDRLQAYRWPDQTYLDVRTLKVSKPTNASLAQLDAEQFTDNAEEETESRGLKIRVLNAVESTQGDFEVGFEDAQGNLIPTGKQSIHVPPGGSRIVTFTDLPGNGVHRIALHGDDHDFDNALLVQTFAPEQRTLIYVSDEPADSRTEMGYFLKQAPLNTPWQNVVVETRASGTPLADLDPARVPLVVVGELQPEAVDALQAYVKQGGRLLVVLGDSQPITDEATTALRRLTGWSTLQVAEAKIKDYAMWSGIDFKHPLFQSFADPQFNDFTKIRFWSHRSLTWSDEPPATIRVLTKFDDQQPALIEQSMDAGTLWVMAAGWQPAASQLALSSKFVPLISAMFDIRRGQSDVKQSYLVGDQVDVPAGAKVSILQAGRSVGSWTADEPQISFKETGTYRVEGSDPAVEYAVNLSSAESRTTALTTDVFEQYAVTLGTAPNEATQLAAQRQKRDLELESEQRIWKWLVLVALALLAAETFLGQRQSTQLAPAATT